MMKNTKENKSILKLILYASVCLAYIFSHMKHTSSR